MKKVLWFLFLLPGIFFASCIEEPAVVSKHTEDGMPVVIKVNAMSEELSGTEEGDVEDRTISSLRVLLYEATTGALKFNIPVDITKPQPYTINIITGTYDFVFIANEGSDGILAGHLTSANNADIDNLSKLRALSFDRTAFSAVKNIPMVKLIEQVEVVDNYSIRTPEMSQPLTGTWPVVIERAAIRLQLGITMTPGQYLDWSASPEITITNIAGKAYVLPGIDNSAFQDPTGGDYEASTVADVKPGFISAADADGNVTVIYDRLILPELFLSPANNVADNVMMLSMKFGAETKSGMLKAADGDAFGYALPRNTFLHMSATVKLDAIEIKAEVLPWEKANQDISFNMYELKVDRTDYYFTAEGGTQPVNVTTNYPGGWSVDEDAVSWGHTLPTPENNTLQSSEYDPVGAVPSLRKGRFLIRAGNLKKYINVYQFPPIVDVTDQVMNSSYVGAFWKADQQGERLIRIYPGDLTGITGKWAAIVTEGVDWIHMDTLMTTDRYVNWSGGNENSIMNGNDPGFDAAHTVHGNLKCVSGIMDASTPEIYFRIGLNSKYTPTAEAPARYGAVILSYADHTKMQRIWIRQGEGADYLMRPEDPSNLSATRDHAVRFSPYNLTAKTLDAQVSINGATDNPNLQPAIFTGYPTQIGAYWQWVSVKNPRYAWNPYTTKASSDWKSGVLDPEPTPCYWSAVGSNNEACPAGYHRPTDGPTNAYTQVTYPASAISVSEVKQSLFARPDNGGFADINYVKGYYADGFFDRRAVSLGHDNIGYTYGMNSYSGAKNEYGYNYIYGVSMGNRDIATTGGLFFNLTTNASLFFPSVARREGDSVQFPDGDARDGVLDNPGIGWDVYYWTSTAQVPGAAWSYVGYPEMSCALAIRCVKNDN